MTKKEASELLKELHNTLKDEGASGLLTGARLARFYQHYEKDPAQAKAFYGWDSWIEFCRGETKKHHTYRTRQVKNALFVADLINIFGITREEIESVTDLDCWSDIRRYFDHEDHELTAETVRELIQIFVDGDRPTLRAHIRGEAGEEQKIVVGYKKAWIEFENRMADEPDDREYKVEKLRSILKGIKDSHTIER